MIKVCDVLCPDKRQALLNVSLSRNTLADRACELATNLHKQLMEKGKDFISYSLAVDESSDTSGTAQLSIFIRGVDSSLCVTEELLALKSMHGTTTGKEIFEEVSKCVTEMKLPWDKLVELINGWCTRNVRSKEWTGGQDSAEDAGELCRRAYSLSLHHTPGIVVWRGPENGTCYEHHNTSS